MDRKREWLRDFFQGAGLSPCIAYLLRLSAPDVEYALPGIMSKLKKAGEEMGYDVLSMLEEMVDDEVWWKMEDSLTDKNARFSKAHKAPVQNAYCTYMKGVQAQVGVPDGRHLQWPVLVQILYLYDGQKKRYHRMFRYVKDYLQWYAATMAGPDPPLQVIEIPVPLCDNQWEQRSVIKFYCDWERLTSTMAFLQGDALEKVERARELALQSPMLLVDIMVALKWISPDATVQVVVKEGTRQIDDDYKASYHFVFGLLVPTSRVKHVGHDLMTEIRKRSPATARAIEDPKMRVDTLDDWGALIGFDWHVFINQHQVPIPYPFVFCGLANIFGRKDDGFPCSAPLYILQYVPGQRSVRRIRPDPNVWTGFQSFPDAIRGRSMEHVRTHDPVEVMRAVQYASICIPGPGVQKLNLPSAANQGITRKNGVAKRAASGIAKGTESRKQKVSMVVPDWFREVISKVIGSGDKAHSNTRSSTPTVHVIATLGSVNYVF